MPRISPEDAQRAHATDVLGAIARDMAHPVAAFYKALRADGVPAHDAVRLAGVYLRKLLGDVAG